MSRTCAHCCEAAPCRRRDSIRYGSDGTADVPSLSDYDPHPDAPGSSDVDLIPYSQIQREYVEWIIPGLVPAGMLTVLAGQQGLGKSMLHVAWAAQLSMRDMVTVLISTEDSPSHTTVKRLEAVGAKREHVYHCVHPPVLGNGSDEAWLSRIRDWVRETKCSLLVLDPLVSMISATSETYRDHHVRRFLAPLEDIARETGCAIVYVMHLTKGEGVDPMNRVSGSVAFTAAARSVVLVARRDELGPTARIIAHVKCNVAELATPQLWHLEPILLDGPRQETTARLVYSGPAEIDIYSLLARPDTPEEKGDRERAVEMLEDMLSFGEEIPTADVERRAKAEGISERTLIRARAALGVKAVQRARQWYVYLPVTSQSAKVQGANPPWLPENPSEQAGSEAQESCRVPLLPEGTLKPRPCHEVGSVEWFGTATRAEITAYVNSDKPLP
jgi:hypothetical protein